MYKEYKQILHDPIWCVPNLSFLYFQIVGVEPQVDEWSKTAKDMLIGFADTISLPDRY